jgi:hypothetical protein
MNDTIAAIAITMVALGFLFAGLGVFLWGWTTIWTRR